MSFSVSEELRCARVTCPAVQVPSCPRGSVLTKSYTPPAGCCPSIHPQCTCDFHACPKPQCPGGQKAVRLTRASGQPGDCCDVFECQKGEWCAQFGTIVVTLRLATAQLVWWINHIRVGNYVLQIKGFLFLFFLPNQNRWKWWLCCCLYIYGTKVCFENKRHSEGLGNIYCENTMVQHGRLCEAPQSWCSVNASDLSNHYTVNSILNN